MDKQKVPLMDNHKLIKFVEICYLMRSIHTSSSLCRVHSPQFSTHSLKDNHKINTHSKSRLSIKSINIPKIPKYFDDSLQL